MKPKTTIVLAALLLVCIVLALFTSDLFDGSDADGPDQAKDVDVFDPACGKPVKLTIEGKGSTFVFEKTGDNWKILEPVAAGAQNWRVDEVADAVKGLKGRPVDEADETTSLAKPIWTITAVDDKKRTHKLLVGRPRPMQTDQTYVRPVGSDKTFLVKVKFAEKLDRPLSDYRDDKVLDLKTDKMARIDVVGQISYELVKRDGKWGVVRPVSAAADEDAVKKVLDVLGSLSASEFVTDTPGDLGPFGLTQPTLLATVEMESETPASIPATTQPASAPAPKPGRMY
jgi:hypothetical protein